MKRDVSDLLMLLIALHRSNDLYRGVERIFDGEILNAMLDARGANGF